MNNSFISITMIALLILAASCASVPQSPVMVPIAESINSEAAAAEPIEPSVEDARAAQVEPSAEPIPQEAVEQILALCASMRVQPGTAIKSVDSGTRILEGDPLLSAYHDHIAFKIEANYYYKGETLVSKYELVYLGVAPKEGLSEAKPGDQIGLSSGEEVQLFARSKELDPYLVACSAVKPFKWDGSWYYFPGMYVSSVMKWLSFEPANLANFKAMHDHATEEENRFGFTYFVWWSLLETTLDEYPALVKDDKEGRSEQVILFGDMPLKLSYQPGFLDYLLDEYTLGEKIYLYLQITGISGSTGEFQCYVRDFSLVPPEVIVDERLAELKGE